MAEAVYGIVFWVNQEREMVD